MQTMVCKHCNAPLPADQLSDDDPIAVCEYCNTVHYLRDDRLNEPPKRKRDEKAKRSVPEKFTFERLADGYELDFRWLGKQHTGLLFFSVIWNGFICFWIFGVLSAGAGSGSDVMGMLAFSSIFVIVGVTMAYYVLVGFMNHTSISIRGDGIEIKHAPLPWIGGSGGTINRDAIKQVFCQRRVAYKSNDVPVYVFDVLYIAKGGDEKTLVKGLDTLHKAIFIEQQVEQVYRIDDRRVSGEYDGAY